MPSWKNPSCVSFHSFHSHPYFHLEKNTLGPRFWMVERRWAIAKDVLPWRAASKAFCTIPSLWVSKALVASSKSITFIFRPTTVWLEVGVHANGCFWGRKLGYMVRIKWDVLGLVIDHWSLPFYQHFGRLMMLYTPRKLTYPLKRGLFQ